VDANHIVVVKRFEEVNNSLKQTEEKETYKGKNKYVWKVKSQKKLL
jgi:hypothetical protein